MHNLCGDKKTKDIIESLFIYELPISYYGSSLAVKVFPKYINLAKNRRDIKNTFDCTFNDPCDY